MSIASFKSSLAFANYLDAIDMYPKLEYILYNSEALRIGSPLLSMTINYSLACLVSPIFK